MRPITAHAPLPPDIGLINERPTAVGVRRSESRGVEVVGHSSSVLNQFSLRGFRVRRIRALDRYDIGRDIDHFIRFQHRPPWRHALGGDTDVDHVSDIGKRAFSVDPVIVGQVRTDESTKILPMAGEAEILLLEDGLSELERRGVGLRGGFRRHAGVLAGAGRLESGSREGGHHERGEHEGRGSAPKIPQSGTTTSKN